MHIARIITAIIETPARMRATREAKPMQRAERNACNAKQRNAARETVTNTPSTYRPISPREYRHRPSLCRDSSHGVCQKPSVEIAKAMPGSGGARYPR